MDYKQMRCKQVHRIVFFAAWLSVFSAGAQSRKSCIKDTIADDQIFSVSFHREGFPLSIPFIYLSSDEHLELMFDDLSPLQRDFSWQLIHCNRFWEEEALSQQEYMEGFPDTRIYDIKTSSNTTVSYRNFRLIFPAENMQILLSGNYVLRIYFTDHPEQTVLTKRFFVSENSSVPEVFYKPADEPSAGGQSFEISWEAPAQKNVNPDHFHLFALQNLRWQFEKELPEARSSGKKSFASCLPGECVFEGGNEYMNFDTKSRRYQSPRIKEMEFKAPYYHIYLYDDKVDSYSPYFFTEDINGNFLVENNETTEDRNEADYMYIHFSLNAGQPFVDEDVYLYGALTNRNLADRYRMQYNFRSRRYEISLLLKQGYYNYEYILKPEKGAPSYTLNGSHSETGNEYLFLLYYTDETRNYDRLLGLKVYNTLLR